MKKTFSLLLCLCLLISCLSLLAACGKEEKPAAPAAPMEPEKPVEPEQPVEPEVPAEPDSRTPVEVSLEKAAFSTPRLEMLADNGGLSYIFYDETGSAAIDIEVVKAGNRFRIYASTEIVPLESFRTAGFRTHGDIIHNSDDTLTEFSYNNQGYKTFMIYMTNNPASHPEANVFFR